MLSFLVYAKINNFYIYIICIIYSIERVLNLSEVTGSIFITVEYQPINMKQMTEKNNNFVNTITVITDVSKAH